jgi:hypothetical protein
MRSSDPVIARDRVIGKRKSHYQLTQIMLIKIEYPVVERATILKSARYAMVELKQIEDADFSSASSSFTSCDFGSFQPEALRLGIILRFAAGRHWPASVKVFTGHAGYIG